ncbi:MAG: hypothetical protein KDA28_07815 [Phycisphaerales bacterium]|nr:hypothetical protein [Phycisphaerales bacterium]
MSRSGWFDEEGVTDEVFALADDDGDDEWEGDVEEDDWDDDDDDWDDDEEGDEDDLEDEELDDWEEDEEEDLWG